MRTIALVAAALAVTACDTRAPEWTAWVYPSRENLTLSISMNGFKTFEQCQNAAIGRLRQFEQPERADYECGYRCRWEPDLGANLCAETRK